MDLKFPDGDVLSRDQRFEDPLVYYTSGHPREYVLGFEFSPEYEYDRVAEVSSRIYRPKRFGPETYEDAWLRLAVQRMVPAMSERNGRWTQWTAEWPPWFVERIGFDVLRAPFIAAGWTLKASSESGADVWVRPKDPAISADWTRPMSQQRRSR